MTRGAANSLLKVVEEPPKDCIFLLLTSFEDRILDTIRSRCGKIAFPLLADNKIKQWLEKNYSFLNDEVVEKIVFASTGRYKLAQKLAEDKEALQNRKQEVENFRKAIKGGLNKAFDLSSEYSKDKEKLLEALDDWIYYLHNFTKESFFKNSDLRIQRKVFEMTRELIEVKIAIETTNANPRLMLENYFVKFS
jgi:DNA polymerase III gamma/tau subunit